MININKAVFNPLSVEEGDEIDFSSSNDDKTAPQAPQMDASISLDNVKTKNSDHRAPSLAHQYYISTPWSLSNYLTFRGSENFHIILWICKDFSWIQDNQVSAIFFGTLAILWCFILLYHAIAEKCAEELYMMIGLITWLCANYVWMFGMFIQNC